MKYKVGDKVKVKSLEWYNNNTSNADFIYCANFIPFTQRMSIFCGCVMTIKSIQSNNIYFVEENLYAWTEDMFEEFTDYKENMENIEITLNDKNYIIDVKKAKELGVIKEKDQRCKSWEEFKLKYKTSRGYFCESVASTIHTVVNPCNGCDQLTQQEAIAIQVFSKLLKLRRDWIGDWEPNWGNAERKYCICIIDSCNYFTISSYCCDHHTFSFPTEEMAKEFLECFRNLFDQCKYII